MAHNTTPPRTVYEGKYQRMVVRGSWEYSESTHAGGLAAIIIGEVLFFKSTFYLRLTGVIVGAVVYRIVIALVLRVGLRSTDMKLFTAILVALALYLPTLRSHARQFDLRRRGRHA